MSNGLELDATTKEIKKFFGASIMMGNLQFPRIRMYWNRNTQIYLVADSMNLNWHFKFRANFHVNSQQQAPEGETCHFWKVAPMIEGVRKRCKKLPLEE